MCNIETRQEFDICHDVGVKSEATPLMIFTSRCSVASRNNCSVSALFARLAARASEIKSDTVADWLRFSLRQIIANVMALGFIQSDSYVNRFAHGCVS